MKFKHLVLFSFLSLVIVSCSKNNGVNFTFTAPVADTAGTSSATPPATIVVGADAPPASGDNSNLLFGNPSNATVDVVLNKDNYLINQGYYVESYNSTKLEPNWVSWHLDNTNTTSVSGRTNNFAAFAGLPSAFVAVQSNSYAPAATYGFDRGHNCPSADRTSSIAANNATFLMTNMIPQAPNNNQQTWGNFENYIRGLTATGYEAYIIMGSYGTGGTGSTGTYSKIGPLNVNVPSYVWKVALILPVGNGDITRVTASTRIITINTPNVNSINSDWKQYIVTMSSIETATGYTLLSALPKTLHDALAAVKDPGQ
jgi:endonuclease G